MLNPEEGKYANSVLVELPYASWCILCFRAGLGQIWLSA